MDGGHKTFLDTKFVVNSFGYGARQFVVHEALDMTVTLGSYASRLTQQINMGASEEGAEIITFLPPPFKWSAALVSHQRST